MQTTVVGSYCVPKWYAALQHAVEKKELSSEGFQDAKAAASKACIKDHEVAGVDVISDGELFRRDNNRFGPPNAMITYFSRIIPGFSNELRDKKGITPIDPNASLPAPVVVRKLESVDLTLLDELHFLRQFSTSKVKIAMTGPHMFARIAYDEHYKDVREFALDFAKIVNENFRKLDAEGCDVIQLDEPVIWFIKDDQEWAIEVINKCFEGVTKAKKAIHICQGNYHPDSDTDGVGLRIFPSQFRDALSIIKAVNVDIVLMAFSGLGLQDENLAVLSEFPSDKILAVGAVDVQNHQIESPQTVATTLNKIAKYIPPDRLWATPDCGLNHLPRNIAFGKLKALAEGAKLFRQQHK